MTTLELIVFSVRINIEIINYKANFQLYKQSFLKKILCFFDT